MNFSRETGVFIGKFTEMEKEDLIKGLLGKFMEPSEEGIAATAVITRVIAPSRLELNEMEYISPNGMPSSEGERIFLLPDDEDET